jgi:hypothetical protein
MNEGDLEKYKKESLEMLASGKQQEEVLQYLRQSGCSKPLSIFVMSCVLRCNSGEANRIVHFSKTWADRKASDELFQEEIWRQIDDMK